MKIAMINGSPKLGKSNSGHLLKTLETLLPDNYEITHYIINKKPLTNEQYVELTHADTLIFAFPLYIDAIPSHLFRMMVAFEDYIKKEKKKDMFVYVLINNGFYEGKQNHVAFEIMENWCKRCGINFGRGIGEGAGEMLGFTENVPMEYGPFKNLNKAMKSLANAISTQSKAETKLLSPNFPRFAWKFSATQFYWHSEAKKNGLTRKDILKKIITK